MARPDERQLSSYLHYGYVPRLPTEVQAHAAARVPRAEVAADGSIPRSELVARGREAFRAACAVQGEGAHVVPLSGGVDSRFILATLLAAGLGPSIVTVAFGVPGALDFELAARVARAAGVRHESIDLRRLVLTPEELAATTQVAPWCLTLEAHFNQEIARRCGPAATYWSGIMANVFAGKDLGVHAPDWSSACRVFAERSRVARGLRLTAPGFEPVSALPAHPPVPDCALAPLEQLYAFVRYPGRIDPALLAPGVRWRTPFRDATWVDFMLRVPRATRADSSFYREIAACSSPQLFALPTKNDLGLRRGAARVAGLLVRARHKLAREFSTRFPRLSRYQNPFLNYVDLEREFRGERPLARLAEPLLARLAARQAVPWLDPLELLTRHRARRANLGEHLQLLLGLELNLALEERRG